MKWPKVAWSEALNIINGKNQKKVAAPNGKYPIYGSGGPMGFANDYLCESGTTVIGRKGSINSPIFVRERFWNVDTAFGLSPKENLDNRFLYYFCTQYNFLKHNKATTLPSLTKRDLLKIQIPLPPLSEQKRIAGILDAADRLRAKRREALAQLDTLLQSTFLDLFGDPVTNPKGWEVVELGNHLKILGGYAFKSSNFSTEGLPIIRISNLSDQGITLEGCARIAREKIGKGARFRIEGGDTLIAMSGATTGKLGYVPVDLKKEWYLNQRVGAFRIPKEGKITQKYLRALLSSSFYQRHVWNLAGGAAQPNISGKQLESAKIPLPPLPLQQRFAAIVEQVESQKARMRTQLTELDTLFAALQQRAFNGEL